MVNDDEPTLEQPAAEPSRPRRVRASAASGALASRSAGWIVAAALGGSLVTILLTGQLHSTAISDFRPSADQQPAGVSRQPGVSQHRVSQHGP